MARLVPGGSEKRCGCPFGGVPIVVLEHVRVGLQNESDVGVTDAIADDLGTHAGLERIRVSKWKVIRGSPAAAARRSKHPRGIEPAFLSGVSRIATSLALRQSPGGTATPCPNDVRVTPSHGDGRLDCVRRTLSRISHSSAHLHCPATLSRILPPRRRFCTASEISSRGYTAATGTVREPSATSGATSRMTGTTLSR